MKFYIKYDIKYDLMLPYDYYIELSDKFYSYVTCSDDFHMAGFLRIGFFFDFSESKCGRKCNLPLKKKRFVQVMKIKFLPVN